MIASPAHALTLGSLDLLGNNHSAGWWIEAAGEGASFGSPQAVEHTILSFLMDGSIASVQSYDNRELTLTLTIEATSSANLAAAESALVAEVGRQNALTWTPPDSTGDFAGTPCVFDVVTSKLEFQFSDMDELNLLRTYTLTVTALPFARSSALSTATNAAPPSTSPTVTSIDACTTTTGWAATTATGSTSVTTSGGSVLASWSNPNTTDLPTAFLTMTRTGLSVNTTSSPYIRIDFTATGSGRYGVSTNTVKLNGTKVNPIASSGTVAWYPFSGTLTSVAVTTAASVSRYGKLALSIADVSRTTIPQDQTGARQRSFTLPVDGSVRSQGTFAVEDPSVALGSALLYTTSDAGNTAPPLRPYRSTTVGDTTDSTLASGFSSDLGTTHVYSVPIAGVSPGGYLLMARIKHATAATYTLSWQARSRLVGGLAVDAGQSGTQTAVLAANTWTMVPVARMILPPTAIGTGGAIRIDLSGVAGLLIDDAWLFNLDTGSLTWVELPTLNRLFIDAPTLETPMPLVTAGTLADRSDAYGPGTNVRSFGQHYLKPPLANVFVVTTGSVAAAVTLTYFARYHTHVAG